MTWYGKDGPFVTDHLVTADEWNSQRVPYFDNDVSIASADNTAAATSIWSCSVPAGALGVSGGCRLTLGGLYLNNTGANTQITLYVVFGGTTYYQDASGNIATSASSRAAFFDMTLQNMDSASSQWLAGRFTIGSAGTTSAGHGDASVVTQAVDVAFAASPTKDTASAQTLEIFVQHNTANASLEFHRTTQIFQLFPALTASP